MSGTGALHAEERCDMVGISHLATHTIAIGLPAFQAAAAHRLHCKAARDAPYFGVLISQTTLAHVVLMWLAASSRPVIYTHCMLVTVEAAVPHAVGGVL